MRPKFILNTNTHWDEPPRARHQVAYSLAKKYQVVFIAANKFGLHKITYSQQDGNIELVQPFFPIDSRLRYRIPLLNELYQIWLFKRIKKHYKDYFVVNFDFTAHLIHRFFKRSVFYCNDNFTSISRKINTKPVSKYHIFCEKRIISEADICIGTTSMITSRLVQFNPRSYEILLGGPNIEEFGIKPRFKNGNKKPIRIGLVGFIRNYNLSVNLVNDILDKVDCTITLIGPVEKEFLNKIVKKDKIIIKGVLTGKDLLEQVNQIDIAIAPYLERKKEEGGMPNKLFIYLALGKPVVVTELRSLSEMNFPEKLIYTVDNMEDFPMTIQKANSENCLELMQQRVNFGKNNTWDKRIELFLDIWNAHFHERDDR